MKRRRTVQVEDCVLSEVQLSVADLGLEVKSEEVLIFQYCNGTCQSATTLHDEILQNVIQSGRLVGDNISPQPCCRPTAFEEDFGFYEDEAAKFHVLRKYSAKECGCF